MSTFPTVVVLAGGSNSRFFPFNRYTHKGGVVLLGQSLVARTLHNLKHHGAEKVIIVVSPKDTAGAGLSSDPQIADAGLDITWVVQPEAKGMGDALLLAKPHLTGQFAVVSPYHYRAGEIIAQLLATGTANAVCGCETSQPWLHGMMSIEHGRLTSLVEKPAPGSEPSKWKIQSMYLLDTSFLDILSSRPEEEYNFETALDALAHQQPVAVLELPQQITTLKYGWDLLTVAQQLLSEPTLQSSRRGTVAPTALLDESHGPIIIEPGATVGDFVKIVGPAYIGENALVGDYSFVRQSAIEAEAKVGANSEVVRSVVMTNSSLHWSYVSDSVVGSGAKIGAGLITANKRLDRQTIQVQVKGQPVDSQRTALGVLIGTRANLGIGVRTMPGVQIGCNATIFPNLTLYHHVDHDQVVKTTT